MPTSGFSIKPLKVKLSAGEQKATEVSAVQLRARTASNAFRATLQLHCFPAQLAFARHRFTAPWADAEPCSKTRRSGGAERLFTELKDDVQKGPLHGAF